MPHQIYGPPEHRLEAIEVKLHLPQLRNGDQVLVTIAGTSSTRRASLWSETLAYARDEYDSRQEVIEAIMHVLDNAWGYRPNGPEGLKSALSSTNFEERTLF